MNTYYCPKCEAALQSEEPLKVGERVTLDVPHGSGALCGGFTVQVKPDGTLRVAEPVAQEEKPAR